MRAYIILVSLILIIALPISAQEEKSDSLPANVKTGLIPGGVPALAYDEDIGFLYGIILNFYHYGDGSRYPMYDHSFYLEWSRTTKGSGKNVFRYDSDRLIPGIRTAFEFSYLTEQALDFYGFNGNKAFFNHDLINGDSDDYISRMFYKMDRKMLRIRTDFSGDLIENKLKWFGGLEFYSVKTDSVDTENLNSKVKEGKEPLPYVGGGLFGLYSNDWGIIDPGQINGGKHTLVKAGLIYDTRDNEPNPMKGIWTEAQLVMAPSFLSNTELGYVKLALTHRQYFTIIPNDLNFAYRLSYQAKLAGEMPYYMLPFVFNSPPNFTRDGLGGSYNLRGVMRNRVVGEDFLYGNMELRWKFVRFKLFNQNIYMALSGFLDGGKVTGDYEPGFLGVTTYEIDGVGHPGSELFRNDESLHLATGGGLHIAMNENFVIAVDYGVPLSAQDGFKNALYIGLNFLY
jgi:hypothetical protein